jgi:phthiocerol/phenolphthiocerol synthesis type-I polyketide synthase D
MTATLCATDLRHWLVDYLITNVGCDHNDIDPEASFWDLGVGSRDAVVLSGELAELLGRPVSPVEFWQHPTINALVEYLTAPESNTQADTADSAGRRWVDEPIAVIGLGCRFPGDIGGPEALWQFLCEGRSAVGEVPLDRWTPFDDGSPEVEAALSGTTRWGSFLTDIDAFDADFFEISPREAARMDPQQRLLLEVAYEALEHAGIPADSLRHTQTGVFAGACGAEYGYLATADLSQVNAWSATGGALSVIANRVSYFFDLRGPSVTVDTACSSSLVAVHLACQSLRSGDSNLAIAAGVNLLLSPVVTFSFDQAEAMSPTGRCHAFDAAADGFVRGEGCGVVVLKRLTDALRDGDRVLAVVRGSAVNQDGRSNGLMAPNPAAQMAVLRAAYASAGVEPRAVDYVEAHGTGTLLGDPIEARALGTVLGRGRPEKSPLLIGSVKSNLGHLEAAAGIAGFIKAVLSVDCGHIPTTLNFENPNPHIPFESLHLKVVAEPTVWPSTEHPRRAGVSSFGFGGTNAHVVLEQGPVVDPVVVGPGPVVTSLVVSGKTAERVALTAGVLAEWMDGDGADVVLADVAHTLNHHRARQVKFATVCARDRGQAVAGLRALAAGDAAPGVVGPHEGRCGPGTVFVFSGQGSQWAGMGRRLLADEPVFAAAVAELEPVFVEEVGFSLQRVLAAGEPVVGIERIQPVLVGVQLALTALWRSYGVEPDAVIGHSMGEVSAAVVAGALSPAQGLRVIARRSGLMAGLAGRGAMALLELDAAAVEGLIADYSDVTVAVYASPRQTVIAGPPEQVDAVIAAVDAQGRLARRIEVDVASHHPTVDPILAELRGGLSDLVPRPPVIPVISTTGHTGGGVMFDADYWVANLRNPVRFSQAVAAAAENHATFIEISPHPLLTYAIGDALPATPSTNRFIVTSALKRAEDETLLFHTQLAALGVTALDADGGRLANIPTSPWLHSRHWVASRPHGQRLPDVHPLLGVHVEMPSGHDHVWQADVGTETMPWLADHMVHGQAVMTVAAYAEMALAAGREALGLPVEAVQVNGLEVEQTLALDRQTQVTTQLAQGDHGIRVEIHARSVGGNWSRYAVAGVDMAHGEGPAGCPEPRAEAGTWYSETEIALPDEAADHPAYCIHPVMLDAALQILAAAASAESLEGPVVTPYLPVSLATVRVFGRIGRWARCRAELVNPGQDGGGALGRIVLTDETGTPTAELTGVCLRRIDPGKVPLPLEQKIFDTQWVESSTSPEIGPGASTGSGGSWLLLADDDAETKALVAEFATRLSSPTRRVITEELSDESAVREAFAKATADSDLPPVGIIVFVGVRSFDAIDSDIALRRARELIWSIWVTARAAVDGWQPKPPRLWLVTRNGLAVRGNEPGDPAIGALKGVIRTWRFPGEAARVLAGEPDLGATLVDLDSADDVVAALMRELDSPAGEDVIAWRQERRYVERLTRATLDEGQREAVVRVDGSYIVTGGLGGLGMAVTRWLVQRGAGRLILNGRTEPSDGQQRDLADLASRAEIVFVRGDIASPGVAERLVAAAEETGRPLRGVVHAAGVSADGLVAALTREGLERVWAPKVAGALRLHAATLTRQLDWWVGFSSMASLLGLPGQTAYASANAWLDALTAWRRASGLPATAINWGQWSDVGMSSAVSFSVLDPITPAEGIEALESVVGGNLTRVGVARLRLDRAVAVTPEFRELGYFERVVPVVDVPNRDNRSTDRSVVVTERDWSQMSAEDRYAELQIGLRAILARELRMPASQLGVDRPFPELGLDSMMAMTVLRDTRRLIGVDLSANMLFNHPTISSLAAYLAEMLAPQQVPQDDRDANGVDVMFDSASGVLDELFASVESASAGSESGNYR